MNRRLFFFVIMLMLLSLAGIILLQLFWIRNAISIRDENFSKNINAALVATAEKLRSHENIMFLSDEFSKFDKLKYKGDTAKEVMIVKTDTGNSASYSYTFDGKPSGNYVVSVWTGKDQPEIVEYKHEVRIDSLRSTIARVKSMVGIDSLDQLITHDMVFVSQQGDTVIEGPENGYLIIKRANDLQEAFIQLAYEIETEPVPITERIEPSVLLDVLSAELFNRGVLLPFEFGILTIDSVRNYPVRSEGFNEEEKSHRYLVSLFPNELIDESNFLIVQFPGRNMHILKSMAWVLFASLLLTLIILSTFAITISMILRQKKLSEIKSDFINNMTHEFKTPIATISLAVDSINSPKIIGNEKEVRYYTGIIREENQRMNNQVESVLRMSLLDKHNLEFNIVDTDIHEVISAAVAKVSLLLRERQGEIRVRLESDDPVVPIDADHMTNAVLNLLDNAIKYSDGPPEIDVVCNDVPGGLRISVIDKGMGMSKDVMQRIFDKFYRKSSGNIHNIKGFGLGLSYVKAIIEAFGGQVSVSSEAGKGSTFEIRIPKK